jgi:5-methylcytosine-specific restriction endonuclease McrA
VSWENASLLWRVFHRKEWRGEAVSFNQWLITESIPISRGMVSKLITAWKLLNEIPEESTERYDWKQLDPTRLYKVRHLFRKDRSKAFGIAKSGARDEDITNEAPDLHLPKDHRTIKLIVDREAYLEWRMAYSLARTHCAKGGVKFPTASMVVQAISAEILSLPHLTNMTPEELTCVLEGEAKCVLCGSYALLERHHVIPRSKGGVDRNGVEQLAFLCTDCHRGVTENETGWRELAAHLKIEVPEGLR